MTRIIMAGIAGLALIASLSAAVDQSSAEPSASRARSDFPLASARAKSPGEAIYLAKCQYCHIEMGPGTVTLAKRVGKDRAMLAARTDLDADYVKTVVRNGLNTMPPITRVEVSDAELDQITAYLARQRPSAEKSSR